MLSAVLALLRRICPTAYRVSLLAASATLAMFAFAGEAGAQCPALAGGGTAAGTTTTYTSTSAVSLPLGSNGAVATGTINTGTFASGTVVTCVSVVLEGVTSNGDSDSSMNYAQFMLTAPQSSGAAGGSQKLGFLGATGDGTDGCDGSSSNCSGVRGVNITVADSASSYAPLFPNQHWSNSPTNQTVLPTSYFYNANNQLTVGSPLPTGASSGSSELANTDGTGTFKSVFVTGSAPPGGVWTLSIADNDPGNNQGNVNGDPISVTGWKLVMTTQASSNVSTSTSLSSNLNPAFTSGANSSVQLTATVIGGGNPVSSGTVTFFDGATVLCSAVAVNSNGQATCNHTYAAEGIHSLSADYGGFTGYNASSSPSLDEYVKNHSSLSGGQYCNSGAIVENSGNITPYPSVINVGTDTSPLGGSVAGVTVTLNGLTDPVGGLGDGLAYLLVAPDRSKAYNLDFYSDAGNGSTGTYNVSFADGSPSMPLNGTISSSTYEATDYNSSADPFNASVSPAPSLPTGTINAAQPDYFGPSAKNFAQAFGGASGNGDWLLFPYNGSGEVVNINNGWCLSFEVNNGSPTTTTLSSSVNPAETNNGFSLTASASSNGSPVTGGTLSIVDQTTGKTLASGAPTMGTLVAGAILTEGDHEIVATYSGVNNVYDPSSVTFYQRIDAPTTVTGNGTAASPARYCNANGITLPSQYISDNIGPANPNPSNIFPTNLPGTLQSVKVEFDGFHTNDPVMTDTATLLVGPNGVGYDFLSGTSNSSSDQANGTYFFADGNSSAPQSNYGPGIYEGSAYDGTDTFFSSPSGFETLPGTFDYAQPHSNPFTFNGSQGAFTGINANGTWSLYFNQNIHDVGAGMTGWCLNFIQNLPSVSPVATHSGTFVQGEQNLNLFLNVTNDGNGPTGDPSNSNPMTVTDTVPTGLAIVSASGSGWTCNTSGQTVTCTTHAAVAQGSGYPQITITTNVPSSTPAGALQNSFSTSGGGANSATSGADSINIGAAPNLSVSKSHTGTFTQGSTAEWDITVSNTATSGTTYGSVTVSDSLPAGYSLNSVNGSGWACGGVSSITCTTSNAEPGGSSFPVIQMIVNVPATSPASVTNTAVAYGGGDLNHTNSGNAAAGSDSNVPVAQVPVTIAISGGNGQSAGLGTAFASDLMVTVTDAASAPIKGSSVTFTSQGTLAYATFSNSTKTITVVTNASGVADSGPVTAAGALGSYNVTASDSPASSATFDLSNVPGPAATLQFTSIPTTAVSGTAFPVTVTAYDAYGNQATGYNGTVNLVSTDPGAQAFAPISMSGGTGTGSVTLVTPGNQTVTATDSVNSSLTVTSGAVAVSAPYLVVNTANDDAGAASASNCTAQSGPGTDTIDPACSLRDALAYAANAGAGSISFDTTAFASAQTITLGVDGTLTVPANVTVTAPTSGSGATATNLVTVGGSDGNGSLPVFTIAGTSTAINNLNIAATTGSTASYAISLNFGDSLTLTNSNVTGTDTGGPSILLGGIFNDYNASLTLVNSTVSGFSSTGITSESGSTLNLTGATITGNNGGIYDGGAAVTLTSSTVSGNTSATSGGGGVAIVSSGRLSLTNSIVAGNTASSNADIAGNYSDGGGNLASNNPSGTSTINPNLAPLGNYGGPTQTMVPLPGSAAICGGIAGSVTSDQRGNPVDALCPSGTIDTGSVQTNYAMTYRVQPAANAIVGAAMIPAPEVAVTESGQFARVSTNSVTMTDSAGVLGGTTSVPLYLAGATFTNLVYSSATSNDTLTATLSLNPALMPPLNLTAQPASTINAYVAAGLTSPTPGTTLSGPSVTFSWTSAPSSTAYQFWVGTTGRGSANLYSSGPIAATSATVSGLPVTGGTVYVRLFTMVNGTWLRQDYTYTAATMAMITSPSTNSALTGFSTTFTWTAGNATGYQLWVGSTGPNSQNIASTGVITATSATIKIPANGETVYVRLYVQFNGVWTYTDYVYTAPTLIAATLTSPTGTLSDISVPFNWSSGTGANSYVLWLGTTPGSNNLFATTASTNTSATAINLPTNGETIYARLFTNFNGGTVHNDYTLTASTAPALTSPAPGSTLSGPGVTFSWSPSPSATSYKLWLGTAVNTSNLYSSGVTSSTSASVIDLPNNGETIYARLFILINGVWNSEYYTYTAGSTPTLTPSAGSTLTSTSQTFQWTTVSGATAYQLWVGTSPATANLYSSGPINATSATVNDLPADGSTVYVRLYSLINGAWNHLDVTYTASAPASSAGRPRP